MDPIADLRLLGFSDYEARAYVALVSRHPLNGYEVAKAAKIPRANVYQALERLCAAGAALRLDTESGVQYAPVAPRELVRRLAADHERVLASVSRGLERIAAPGDQQQLWNARGYDAVLAQARAAISGAHARLLIALGPPEADALHDEVARAEGRGVEITILCMEACPTICSGCRGQVHRVESGAPAESRWLLIVADARHVIAGRVATSRDDAIALVTDVDLVAELAASYIRHTIALARISGDLEQGIGALLAPETQATLRSLASSERAGAPLLRLVTGFGQQRTGSQGSASSRASHGEATS